MTPGLVLAVVLGGLVGAPARYLVDRTVTRRSHTELPVGTMVVNVTGSFVLGLITGVTLSHGLSLFGATLLGTGFCGSYTTFSTFTFEAVRLVEEGRLLEAALSVGLSVAVGLAAAGAGVALGLAV